MVFNVCVVYGLFFSGDFITLCIYILFSFSLHVYVYDVFNK